MDIQRKIQALQALRSRQASAGSRQGVILKIAIRWLTADINRDYDIMLRLQCLEGAADQRDGVWWKHGRSGLRKARAELSSYPIQPDWFSKDPTGMYKIVDTVQAKYIRSYRLTHVEPLDLIHSALMGIPVKTWDDAVIEKVPRSVGRNTKDKILSGKEGPKPVAKRMSSWFKNTVNKEWKHVRNQPGLLPTDEDGKQLDAPDNSREIDFGEAMAYLVWKDKNNPIGRKLRALMRKVWSDSEPMLIWLDMVEKTGKFPDKKDVAQAAGIANSGFVSKHWKKRWMKLVDTLWRDKRLLSEMKDLFQGHGLEWGGEKPSYGDVEKALTNTKTASIGIERVATRYLLRVSHTRPTI